MKIKVDIDLDELLQDIFDDYDPEYGVDVDLKEEVKNDIIFKAKQAVLTEIKQPIKDDIEDRIKILVKDAYASEVEEAVKGFVKDGVIKKGRYSSDPPMTVNEWIEANFEGSINNDKLRDIVSDEAKKVSQELKNRYDMFFATQLVMKMNDQGLLKDGVMSVLDIPKEKE